MDWTETILVSAAVLAAVVYLLWQTVRRRRKGGCGTEDCKYLLSRSVPRENESRAAK